MIKSMQNVNKNKSSIWPYLIVSVIGIIYAYLSFQTPTALAMTRFKISLNQLNLLKVSVILPVMIIWFSILYAAVNIWEYAKSIDKGLDGEGFNFIAKGFFLFLTASIVSSFISLTSQLTATPGTQMAINYKIFSMYTTLALNLLGYLCIYLGSRKFILVTKTEKLEKKNNVTCYLILAAAAVIYTVLVFNNPYRTVSPNPILTPPTYGVSDTLIVATIMIPTVITWLFGILSISNLMIYKKNSEGSIYKSALKNFYVGFILVVGLIILLNFVTQFSSYWATTGIKEILIFIYVILGVIILGYIFAAIGSRKLHKLEVV